MFTISLPRGVNFDDLAEGLIAKRSKDDFERVAHFGFGRYEIKTASEKIAKELLLDPTIKVRDTDYQLNYLGNTTTRVSVFFYPVDQDISNLRKTLESFGKISKIEEARYKKHSWGSGVWQVFIDMQKPIPNYVKVNADNRYFVVQCEYQGVTRVCRKCGREGHLNSNCNTPKCARCGIFGHSSCTAPCPRCYEDHAVSECRKKTFAAALGYSRGLVPALDIVPDMSDLSENDRNNHDTTLGETAVHPEVRPQVSGSTEVTTSPETYDASSVTNKSGGTEKADTVRESVMPAENAVIGEPDEGDTAEIIAPNAMRKSSESGTEKHSEKGGDTQNTEVHEIGEIQADLQMGSRGQVATEKWETITSNKKDRNIGGELARKLIRAHPPEILSDASPGSVKSVDPRSPLPLSGKQTELKKVSFSFSEMGVTGQGNTSEITTATQDVNGCNARDITLCSKEARQSDTEQARGKQSKRKRKKPKKKRPEGKLRPQAEEAISFIKKCSNMLQLSSTTDTESTDSEEYIGEMHLDKRKPVQQSVEDFIDDTESSTTRFYSFSSVESLDRTMVQPNHEVNDP